MTPSAPAIHSPSAQAKPWQSSVSQRCYARAGALSHAQLSFAAPYTDLSGKINLPEPVLGSTSSGAAQSTACEYSSPAVCPATMPTPRLHVAGSAATAPHHPSPLGAPQLEQNPSARRVTVVGGAAHLALRRRRPSQQRTVTAAQRRPPGGRHSQSSGSS